MAKTESPESIANTVSVFLAGRGSAKRNTSIVFDDLSVQGWGRGTQPAPTVLSMMRSWLDVINPSTYTKHKPWRFLLHSFSGTLDPGEMLMVIGKPGSGCSTFLKSLANMQSEYKDTTGRLIYNGIDATSKDNTTLSTFCAEEDSHIPILTVAETLRFAIRSSWDPELSRSAIDTAVQTLAKSVGLGHVLHTKVGDAAIRGVSGGERRRVSLAEAMATFPDLLCIDNPTNGLDSANALEFIELAREFTTQRGCVTAMSVYQGSNSMVPLFDKVLVINSGREIFYGRASEAKPYFEELGFECPERSAITDFLNSMTAEHQLRHVRPGYEHRAPRTALQLEEAFRSSPYYRALQQDMAAALANPADAAAVRANPTYALPIYRQVAECAVRQMRVLIRDHGTWRVNASCLIVQSVLLGTVFRDQPQETQAFFLLSSSMFYLILVALLQAMNEFGSTFAQRSLVIRHKEYRLYRPLSYSLALTLTDLPWKLLTIVYNIPQYFMTGFQTGADKFFIWFLSMYIEHLALSMIFRATSVFSPSMDMAVLPVGALATILICYTGLYIPVRQMQVWLSWLRYLDPVYYAYESTMVNEFGNLNYTCSTADLAPNGPGYNDIAHQVCAVSGATPGSTVVSGRDYLRVQYGFEVSNLWRNVGINAAIFAAFTILTAIGMEFYKTPAGKLATIFYKAGKKDLSRSHESSGSDTEKGEIDDDVVPDGGPLTAKTTSRHVAVHNGKTLMWRNASLEITLKDGPKRLLDNINGFIKPGSLTALMGKSGAGKSTLLNALAGRIEFGKMSGDFYLDGQPLPKSFRRMMGYVQQQDVHLPSQTVREALQMTARLRRPQDISVADKDGYVEDIIRILDMEDIADALIGVPGAGMNLEQRKRLTIGVELSAMPDILFLDEPTSGLDGQSAIKIVRLLKKLANSGQTVLCTIHQPAAEVIETFDNLILLVQGGKLAYQGPFGEHCLAAIEYFSRYSRACSEDENPAEYLLDIVGAGSQSTVGQNWTEIWNKSPEKAAMQAEIDHQSQINQRKTQTRTQMAPDEKTYATSIFFQLPIVVKRTWLFQWRDPDYFRSKLLMNVIQALANGLSYLNAGNNQQGVYNRVFSLFVALIVGPTIGLMIIQRFMTLRDLFAQREQASRTYHWLAFVIAAIVVELPFAFVTTLVYWLLWYYPVGYFTESSRAGYVFLQYQLFAVFVLSLAQICAAIMPTMDGAMTANGLTFMFVNSWAGTLVPRPTTPSGWSWYFNVSPLYYFSEGTTSVVLEGLQISCSSDETILFQPPLGQTCQEYAANFLANASGYLTNPGAGSDCEYCRYKDGQSYYAQYGYDFAHRYKNIGIFIGFIAFNYTAVILITYLTRVKKWRK